MNLPGAPWAVAFMLSFDMPLFTFLSGYVLFGREGTHPLRFLRGKALALLVPYFAWVAVATVQRHIPPRNWLSRMLGSAVNPHLGFQMWYLWVLFAIFVLFTLARLVSTSDLLIGGLALICGAALLLPLPDLLGADKVAWLFPFLVFGYLAGKYRGALRRYDLALAAAGVAAFVALTWLHPGGVAARFATGLSGVAAWWAVFRALPRPFISAQARVGRLTLGIYGGQMVLLPYLIVGSGWLGFVASEASVLAGATALAWLLSKTPVTRAAFLGQWPRPKPALPSAAELEATRPA